MAYIDDLQQGGIWPLQHSSYITNPRPLDNRAIRFGARIVDRHDKKDADHLGHYVVQDNSVGDVTGWLLWQNAKTRPIPTWASAFPSVITSASGSGGTTSGAPQNARPIRSEAWDPDSRFVELGVSVHPDQGAVPCGTVGITLAGTEENEQQELFFPTDRRLVAVNWAGDPAMASLVADLDNDNCIDPERVARLHSMMRVVRTRPGLLPFDPDLNGIAFQLSPAGQDALEGYGLMFDSGIIGVAGKIGSGPFDVGEQFDQHRIANTADGEPINSLHINTNAYFISPGSILVPQRVAPGPGGILVTAITGDAPLEFRDEVWTNPPEAPYKTRAFIRYDPFELHPFLTQDRDGMWKLEATAYDYVCDPRPDDIIIVPPPPGPGEEPPVKGEERIFPPDVVVPSDGDPTINDDVQPQPDPTLPPTVPVPQLPSTADSDLGRQIERWIQRGLNDLSNYTPRDNTKFEKDNQVATGLMRMSPGTVFRPQLQYLAGVDAPDLRNQISSVPNSVLAAYDAEAPAIMRLEGIVCRVNRSPDYTISPHKSRYCGGSSSGVMAFMSPEQDMADIAKDFDSGVPLSESWVTAMNPIYWATGRPKPKGCGIMEGHQWRSVEQPNGEFHTIFESVNSNCDVKEVFRLTEDGVCTEIIQQCVGYEDHFHTPSDWNVLNYNAATDIDPRWQTFTQNALNPAANQTYTYKFKVPSIQMGDCFDDWYLCIGIVYDCPAPLDPFFETAWEPYLVLTKNNGSTQVGPTPATFGSKLGTIPGPGNTYLMEWTVNPNSVVYPEDCETLFLILNRLGSDFLDQAGDIRVKNVFLKWARKTGDGDWFTFVP